LIDNIIIIIIIIIITTTTTTTTTTNRSAQISCCKDAGKTGIIEYRVCYYGRSLM